MKYQQEKLCFVFHLVQEWKQGREKVKNPNWKYFILQKCIFLKNKNIDSQGKKKTLYKCIFPFQKTPSRLWLHLIP